MSVRENQCAALAGEYARRGAALGLVARRRGLLGELAAGRDFDADVGGADIVIANAGISIGALSEYYEDLQTFKETYETNMLAMAYTFHPFIAAMRARQRGALVGIASVAGVRGLPGSEAYCASKAASICYLESLRVELKRAGVMVTTIAPGFIRTSLVAKNPYKMPFLMEPADFARKAAEAISAGARYRVIPWQMGWVAKLLRAMPNWMFDRIMAKRGRKPRRQQASS